MYSQDLNALSEMLGMSKEAENEVVYRHLSWRKTKNRNIKDIIILDVIIVDSAYANTSHPCSFCRYAQPFNKLEYVNHSFKEFVDVPIGAIEKVDEKAIWTRDEIPQEDDIIDFTDPRKRPR